MGISDMVAQSIKKGDILLTDDRWFYVESDPAFPNSGYFYSPRAIADISYDYKNYTDEEICEFYIRDTLGGIRRNVEEKLEKYADDIRKSWKIETEGLLVNAIYKTKDGSCVLIISNDSGKVVYQEVEEITDFRATSEFKKKSIYDLGIIERVK